MADHTYRLELNLSDGTKVDAGTFTVPQGDQGPQGAAGAQGTQGIQGAAGKTAYQYAVDGGYTGTEADFAAKLAKEQAQPDWNQTDSTAADFIKNKPTIPQTDSALSDASENPVQNKVVKAKFDELSGEIDIIRDSIATVPGGTVEVPNYNLMKTSEIVYESRLQDGITGIISSNTNNFVTGWIEVEYGKYYTVTYEIDGVRNIKGPISTSSISRINTMTEDGTETAHGNAGNSVFAVSPASSSTICITDDTVKKIRLHCAGTDAGTEAGYKSLKYMLTEGDTAEEAQQKGLTSAYIDGDDTITEETPPQIVVSDGTKADKVDLESLTNRVEAIENNSAAIENGYGDSEIIKAISNLRTSDTNEAKDFTISISNDTGVVIKNATIAVGLHNTYGVPYQYNQMPYQVYDDVFEKNTGIKFFDGDTELSYYIESERNCNYVEDGRIAIGQKEIAITSDYKIIRYDHGAKQMKISSDDGATWTNICSNITDRPYRVHSIDSRDNLFVAEPTGYQLYKYTPADGYQTGTMVLDMTDNATQIGSIMAEDSLGNLYVGTYQTEWKCTLYKSTDEGDNWSVVFNSTDNQHFHNIFINTKVVPNEIFIGLDGAPARSYVSTDYGATWTLLDVPYGNRDNAFRYAGENFYIGCGERNFLGGSALYKTTDYNDTTAYYPLFDNAQGIRDVRNVIQNSDDVLIAGGCVGAPVSIEQLLLSEDRGETWFTVLMDIFPYKDMPAGKGLRIFTRYRDGQFLAETWRSYCLRFIYAPEAKTILALVNVGDIPVGGKSIMVKTGYVTNVEKVKAVLTTINPDGEVADIKIMADSVVDRVSNKRVMTSDTKAQPYKSTLMQTSQRKVVPDTNYRLNGSVNLGRLSRLNFHKGFTVSMLFKTEPGKNYLEDYSYHTIFKSGTTELALYRRSVVLMHNGTSIYGSALYLGDEHLNSVRANDYVRVVVYFTADTLPTANCYTDNVWLGTEASCTEYPISVDLSENDFIVGNNLTDGTRTEMPNISEFQIYNRVLSHAEILGLTYGCNLVTENMQYS